MTQRRGWTATLLLVLLAGLIPFVGPAAGHAADGRAAIALSPAGPYAAGDVITVTGSDFPAFAPVTVGFCQQGRTVRGPGDCVSSVNGTGGHLDLVPADASGAFVTTLTVIVGSLENQTAPTVSCGPGQPCRVTATDVGDIRYSASIQVQYTGDPAPVADTYGPRTVLTSSAPQLTTVASTTFTWSATDTEAGLLGGYEVRARTQNYDDSLGPWAEVFDGQTFETTVTLHYGIHPGEVRCLGVRARDAAGNVGPWATSCAARALDDRALRASASWKRLTGKGHLDRTVTATRTHGAKLRLRHVHANRLALLATHCPTCGRVSVSINGKRVASVQLRGKHTHKRVMTVLPSFKQRTGTVVVTVLSKHKKVQIDGIVVSRS